MPSHAPHPCVSCGVPLPATASLGMCPACAFREALALEGAEAPGEGVLRRIGDYDLLDEAGRGGMGVVYRARQRSLQRIVAIKVLLGGYFAGEEGRRRFRAEAAAAARLSHPGIVAVHEAGEADGQPFYSMAFIEGQTLAAMLRSGPLPCRQAAMLAQKIAAALHCAHTLNVLHRDLKPSNILLDQSGAPHVADFGLAKLLHDACSEDGGPTLTNQIAGSPAWMAPEQSTPKALPLTPAVDIYALGAILYEMLTGRPPFHGETPQAVLEQVRAADPVPPRRLNASIPADLETVCLKCLEKEPRRRYAGAEDLAAELGRFLAGEPVLANPPGAPSRIWRWARRHRAAAAMLSVVFLALVAVATVMVLTNVRVSRAREIAEASAEQSRRHLLRSHIIAATHFMDAEDTQRALAFLIEAQGMEGPSGPDRANRVRLATTAAHSPQPVKLWRAGGLVSSVQFSADGKRLVCANGTPVVRVWSADPADDREVTLSHAAPALFATFNADGTRLITAGDSEAQLWDGASHQRIGPSVPHAGDLASLDRKRPPLFSADGSCFLSCSGRVLRRWSVADGTALGPDLTADAGITAFCFLPDADQVLVGTERGDAIVFNALNGQHLTTIELPEPARSLSVDRAGRRAAAICGSHRLVLFDPASPGTAVLEGLHDSNAIAYQADFLPGGKRVLSCSFDGSVRVWDATKARLLKTLPHPGGVTRVAHSRDGRRAVSACWDGGARVVGLPHLRPDCGPMIHAGPVSAIDLAPAGDLVASAGYDDTVRLWRVPTPAPVRARGFLQPDDRDPGRAAVSSSPAGTLTVIDPCTGQALSPPIEHRTAVLQIRLSFAASRLAARDAQGVTLWDTANGRALTRLANEESSVDQILMTPDGSRILHVAADGSLLIFRTSDGAPTGAPIKLFPPVHAIALSPDGRWVAAAGADLRARVWSTEDGSLQSGPFGEADGIQSITWSADSRRLAAASGPAGTSGTLHRTLRGFDPVTGHPVTPPMSHNDDITATAFSPDGRWIATGCEDMQARLFDATTGALCCPPLAHDGFVTAVSFSSDGLLLATASDDASMRLWEAPGGRSASHKITTPSAAHRVFFSPAAPCLIGWFGSSDRSSFRSASLEIAPLDGMTERDYLTAISGFRMNATGDLEPVLPAELQGMWNSLRRAASGSTTP